jgi:hypothetical protein
MSDSLFVLPELVEENAALIQGVVMIWVELERVLKAQEGLIRARKLNENVATLPPQRGVVRPKLYRLVEDVEGLLTAPMLLQDCSEACKIFGLGCASDRADDPLQGFVVLFRVEKQEPHEMLGVGVLRIDSEGLLAANTGVEMPSVPKMLNARFTISGWCAHRCSSPVHGERPPQWRQRLLFKLQMNGPNPASVASRSTPFQQVKVAQAL